MAPEGAEAMESDQGPMYYSPEMVTPVGGPGMGYAQETMGGSAPCGMERGMCGAGMMGCHGGIMGPGMMRAYGMHPILQLDLSDAQRAQINKTADSLRQQQWATMGKIMDERSKLRDLYATEQPDPKQVGDVYGAIAKLREEMVVAQVKAHNEAVALLTNEQREQLKRWERGHWGPSGSAAGQAAQPSPPPAVPPPPPPPP